MRNSPLVLTWLAIGVVCLQNEAQCDDAPVPVVRISSRDPHYFETDDGRPYVPNGLNVISPPWLRSPSLRGAPYLIFRSSVSELGITLAPKKLIRTRRASEGNASEPSLARRVSMCKDAKLSCRGNMVSPKLSRSVSSGGAPAAGAAARNARWRGGAAGATGVVYAEQRLYSFLWKLLSRSEFLSPRP